MKKPSELETTYGVYTIETPIGEGASGHVYRARDPAGSPCAVKVLDPARTTRERRKRFQNEIRFCEHPRNQHVVRVIDRGVASLPEGVAPFYVMPLYSGSLRNLLHNPPGHPDLLILFDQVLSGVQAAHLLGVTHRDLKPENILFDSEKTQLLVADFGVAQFTDEDLYTAVETTPGTRLANFQYAAPEQRTRGRKVGVPADVFALGLMLNEMFTAEVPQGTGYKTIASVASNYSWADDLVAKMIQQDPDARPQSVEQIKLGMLAYEREFVTRQKLNALEKTVVPVSMDDDPLLADPPRVVDFSYNNGTLTIILSRTVNPLWIWAFRNMSGYQYHNDKSPASFRLKDDRAEIQNVHEKEVQMTIDDFKLWIPFAMTKYKERIDSDRRAEVAALHEKLRLEREDLERQQRLRKNIRI